MTVSAERIAELACYSDDALAAMCGADGYFDWTCSGEYLHATLEEVEAVFNHRAEADAKFIRDLSDEDRAAYVESGELSAADVAKAMGKPSAMKVKALSLAKRELVAHDEKTGDEVKVGDTVISFRGEPATLISLDRPAGNGRSGKVTVEWAKAPGTRSYYYDGVFGLTVSELAK